MNELVYALQVIFQHFTSETLHWVPWEWQLEYEQKKRWDALTKATHETDDAGQQAELIKMQRDDVLEQDEEIKAEILAELQEAKKAQGAGDQAGESRHLVNVQRYKLQLSKLDDTVKQLDELARNAFAGHDQLIQEILTTRGDMKVQTALDRGALAENKAARAQARLEQFRRNVSGLIPVGAGAATVTDRMREETQSLTAKTRSQSKLTNAWLEQRDATRRAQAAQSATVTDSRIADLMKEVGYTPSTSLGQPAATQPAQAPKSANAKE